MKKFFIPFAVIFAVSFIAMMFVWESLSEYGEGIIYNFFNGHSSVDVAEIVEANSFFRKQRTQFDEYLFENITGSDNYSINSGKYSDYIDNIISLGGVSDRVIGFLERAASYYANGTEAKLLLFSDSYVDEGHFMDTYGSIQYSYSAAEAVMRILGLFSGTDYNGIFIPDVVSSEVLKVGSCNLGKKDDEIHEIILKWYVAYSALKSSFDAEYLKILFGKNFYSKKEIINSLYYMDSLLSAMGKCYPPAELVGVYSDNYTIAFDSYNKKMELAQYYGLRLFPDRTLVNLMADNTYSYISFDEIIKRNIGFDSFRTLASVAVFELYFSK